MGETHVDWRVTRHGQLLQNAVLLLGDDVSITVVYAAQAVAHIIVWIEHRQLHALGDGQKARPCKAVLCKQNTRSEQF